MPIVMVSRSSRVDDNLLRTVVKALPTIVAENLTLPEHPFGGLTADDVEVRVQDSPFNVTEGDLDVLVFATKFEARIRTGQNRSDKMALDVQALLPSEMKGYVWVILADAFFSTFG